LNRFAVWIRNQAHDTRLIGRLNKQSRAKITIRVGNDAFHAFASQENFYGYARPRFASNCGKPVGEHQEFFTDGAANRCGHILRLYGDSSLTNFGFNDNIRNGDRFRHGDCGTRDQHSSPHNNSARRGTCDGNYACI
jgi:hypothetical protein